MEKGKHDPTDTMINAMQHMDHATHALVVVAFEDGSVEVRTGYMTDWMVKGLLREALSGYGTDAYEQLDDSEED